MGGTLLPHKNSQHFAAPPRDTTKPNQRKIKSPVFLERLNCRAIFLRLILPLLENKAKYGNSQAPRCIGNVAHGACR
jgi:hypothetical protein